ncbi:hypothetical protein LOZ55_001107 [Ophidiomyces ophidiicola]|nr:hypothetical protein LOZ55_001107 [Ophidiomyces ophidiicola]
MPPLTPFFSPTNSLLAVLLLIAFPAHGSQLYHLQINDTYPEDSISWGHVLRRDASVARRLRIEQPTAVRKMTDDEGEKFWMGYWGFDVKYNGNRDVEDIQRGGRELRNETMLQPAYPVHGAQRHVWFGRELVIMKYLQSSRVFSKRGFNCPTNTQPCTSISRPNSCCALGTTCQIIPNTGLGDVGCCPGSSTTCSGQIKSCPDGYANCAGFPGGGCCIPGYSCVSNGCLFVSTTTVTVTASTPSSTSTSTSSASSTQISPPTRPTSNPVTTATVSPAPTSTSTSEIPDICPTGF